MISGLLLRGILTRYCSLLWVTDPNYCQCTRKESMYDHHASAMPGGVFAIVL